MLEAVMLWNELNNPAHWFGGRAGAPGRVEDPEWRLSRAMVGAAAVAARRSFPGVERVFPGLSPIEPAFLARAAEAGVLPDFDAVAGHNFWLDFGPASVRGESGLDALPREVDAFGDASERLLGRRLPLLLSEIGVCSFSGDELQAWAAERTLGMLGHMADRDASLRVTWYSLLDLPDEYPVTTLYDPDSHGEVRQRKLGLSRMVDGSFRPKRAARVFARRRHPDRIGITQWFRMPWPEPERGITPALAHDLSYRELEAAARILRELEVQWLRVNVTWCDWYSARMTGLSKGLEWFDDLFSALADFRLLVTIFQTPHQLAPAGAPYASGSVPRAECASGFAGTVVEVLRRYAPPGLSGEEGVAVVGNVAYKRTRGRGDTGTRRRHRGTETRRHGDTGPPPDDGSRKRRRRGVRAWRLRALRVLAPAPRGRYARAAR